MSALTNNEDPDVNTIQLSNCLTNVSAIAKPLKPLAKIVLICCLLKYFSIVLTSSLDSDKTALEMTRLFRHCIHLVWFCTHSLAILHTECQKLLSFEQSE